MELDPFVSHTVKSFFEVAKNLIATGDEVIPQVWFLARQDSAQTAVPLMGIEKFFESKERKAMLRGFLKQLWHSISERKKGIELMAVVSLSDSWVQIVSLPEGEKILREGRTTAFVTKPGMAEALQVVISLADGDISYMWSYVRGEEGVVFAAEPSISEYPGGEQRVLLMGLWPL